MKKFHKKSSYRWVLVAIILVVALSAFTGCATPKEEFESRKENVGYTEATEVLDELKELCKEAFEKADIEVEDFFISAGYMNNHPYVTVHTLLQKKEDKTEYVQYSVEFERIGLLTKVFVNCGDNKDKEEVLFYLRDANPRLEKKNLLI